MDNGAAVRALITSLLFAVCWLPGCYTPTYEVRGRVAGFGDDDRTIIVEHEEVPGLMPPMTMPFRSADTAAVAKLELGDPVGFTLHVSPDSSWITDLRLVPEDAVSVDPEGNDAEFAPAGATGPAMLVGDPVPVFHLVAETGDSLNTEAYRGKAWVVTFLYTRCPLPEYCPLLTKRFRSLQSALLAQRRTDVRMLSVSFDPEHDTPEVLADYGRRNGANPGVWTLATGDPAEIRRMAQAFGVYYSGGGTDVSHNLVTAVVGPDMKLLHVWHDNAWTARDVLGVLDRPLPAP